MNRLRCALQFFTLFVAIPFSLAQTQGVLAPQGGAPTPELQGARQLAATGQYPAAIAAYQKFLSGHPQNETAQIELAEAYRRVHNYDEAQKVLQLARKQHPRSLHVLKTLGNLDLEAESYDAAIEVFRAALALAPRDAPARTYLGTAYQGKNDNESALAEFNRVLSEDPKNQLARYLRAQLLSDSGENAKALSDAEAVVTGRPEYLPGRVLLAKILIREKQCQPAIDTLQTFHAAKRLDAQGLFVLANAYDCGGQPEQAKTVRDEFAAASQADHQRAENETQSKHLVEQANQLAQQNKFAEALDLAQQALEKNPENAFAYSQRAKILFSRRDFPGARAEIQQALKLQPFQPDFLYVSGMIALREGKTDEALDSFTKITQINAKEADAFYQIGLIHLQQGDRAAAVAALRAATTLEPQDQDYRQALAAASKP
jgi:tetratricopeptide (TPR) repeat protein